VSGLVRNVPVDFEWDAGKAATTERHAER
jgi:hypothetical protein